MSICSIFMKPGYFFLFLNWIFSQNITLIHTNNFYLSSSSFYQSKSFYLVFALTHELYCALQCRWCASGNTLVLPLAYWNPESIAMVSSSCWRSSTALMHVLMVVWSFVWLKKKTNSNGRVAWLDCRWLLWQRLCFCRHDCCWCEVLQTTAINTRHN